MTEKQEAEVTFSNNASEATESNDNTNTAAEQNQAPETETLLKRINDQLEFIDKLKEENYQLREVRREFNEFKDKAAPVDEVLKRLEERSTSETAETNKTNQLDKDELLKEVTDKVLSLQQEKELQETYTRNWDEVTTKLTESFGDKVDEVVQTVAKDYGMTMEEAVEDARRNPKRFLKMFDLDTKGQPRASSGLSQGLLNTNAVANTTGRKDREYYKNLRKTNPNLYWSPEVQKEIMASGAYKE